MSKGNPDYTVSRTAAAAITDDSPFFAMVFNSSKKAAKGADGSVSGGEKFIGVLQEQAVANERVAIRQRGITKMLVGAAGLNPATDFFVGYDSTGRANPVNPATDVDEQIIGVWLVDENTATLAAGEEANVSLLPTPLPVFAGAAPVAIADPGNGGAIPVTRTGVCAITTAGAGETRTVDAPTFVGQRLVLIHDVDGGDVDITVATEINKAGNTAINLADAKDFTEMVAAQVAGSLVWRVVQNDGPTLS